MLYVELARIQSDAGIEPKPQRQQKARLRLDTVSKRVADIGEAAGVKVAESERSIKYASAHDLRRAFGFRWSRLVMPAVLKELMRHETFQTTMEDYVGQNAEATADVVWSAIAKHSAKRTEFEVPDSAETKPQPADG